MSKKKHKKRNPKPEAKQPLTARERLLKKGNETMEIKTNALNKGEYSMIFVAGAMLMAAFVLSVVENIVFPFKQTLVFLLMGLGCLVLAYLQSKTIRMKKSGGKTALFWLCLVMGTLYTLGGLITVFMPELLA